MRGMKAKRRRKPYTILFVCTANLCRSPMAEGILRQQVSSNELKDRLTVMSAGGAAADGQQASSYAQEVCAEAGIDVSCHRSQPVTRGLLRKSDLVLVMTPSHKREIEEMNPAYRGKTFLLREYGRGRRSGTDLSIDDPYGGTKETYEVCFLRIEREVQRILPELKMLAEERREGTGRSKKQA